MSNPILVTVRYTVKDGKREEFYRHIVEQGKHDELLARNGFYAKLYHSQFEG